MTEETLRTIRSRIESLASEESEYYLVCGRTGERPVPATDLRFESRLIGRAAARLTEQYRAILRQHDQRLPAYDIIVCQSQTATESAGQTQAAEVGR